MTRLQQVAFRDGSRALREWGEVSCAVAPEVVERLELLLTASPDPEQALRFCARLLEQHPSWFLRFAEARTSLRSLIGIFTHSHFLAEEILQNPECLERVLANGSLQRVISQEQFRDDLAALLSPGLPPALEFAQFRRRQILRILIRDVLGLAPLPEITGELTALADAIVETAFRRLREQMVLEYGTPQAHGSKRESFFSVVALGKMGGQELNYSSDIDLMFLYSQNGETSGSTVISNKEFFRRLANGLTHLLSTHTSAGMCYRVDLRLRPDGSQGEVCISLEAARDYYQKRARDWELQMLIKARVAAGDRATGRALLDFVEPRTYSTSLDFSAIESLSATRERLNEKLAARLRPTGFGQRADLLKLDVKLERGGIRDIEFLVQCLQRLHGGVEPWVRHGGTLLSLARLQDKGFISGAEFGRLASAYQFLRQLEHRLQCADDLQTHVLSLEPADLASLAARIPGAESSHALLAQLRSHLAHVSEIYDRVVHSNGAQAENSAPSGLQPGNVVRALEQTAPQLAMALAKGQLRRGFRSFEHFLERVSQEQIADLNQDANLTAAMLELFEFSPYFAEELIRTPELMQEVRHAGEPLEATPANLIDLRRWYRRGMTRVQAGSICHAEPVFESLARTSELADAVIARSYQIAVEETCLVRAPQAQQYRPLDQMFVIALGRLGMLEFDLASDADLVFVLADADAGEIEFWTHVARRLVDSIMTYTGEGVLFAVDTRLRPNGVDGPLVLTERSFKDYFEKSAEAWEGITYMKSRVVAGDAARGQAFLHQLQAIDWQRYGLSGRSRVDLRQMRMKIEREQGMAHPFKSGRGGYYDIDFMLMYLRLKSAGVYFKVLNTPERIDVLESMGHLDKAGAQFLRRSATFYRALDHGIRLLTGHADDKLPSSQAQVETLNALLKRWTNIPLDRLEELRSQTRAAFDGMFG